MRILVVIMNGIRDSNIVLFRNYKTYFFRELLPFLERCPERQSQIHTTGQNGILALVGCVVGAPKIHDALLVTRQQRPLGHQSNRQHFSGLVGKAPHTKLIGCPSRGGLLFAAADRSQ